MKRKKKPMTRSENMSRIKSKNTKPEVYLRKLLWSRGFRYRCNYKNLPGKPDIYMKKYNTAIFVNGCFWHMHEGCKNSNIPKNNHEFWKEKLEKNVERDKKNYKELNKLRIKVIIVWECTIRNMVKNKEYEEEILNNIISLISNSEKLNTTEI